jgi:hypothetical protein
MPESMILGMVTMLAREVAISPRRTRSGLQGRKATVPDGSMRYSVQERSKNERSRPRRLQPDQPQMGSSPNRSIQYSAGVFSIPAAMSSTRNENR